MNAFPKVSIAIVTYNQKAFLMEAINSILLQQYPNMEIIIADDGSTDGTKTYLEELDKNNPGIYKILLSAKNEGITPNCNKAFKACTGKYIAWLGGDDIMLKDKISTQVKIMEEDNECVICYHNLDVFESDSGKSLLLFNGGKNGTKPHQGGAGKLIQYGTFCGASSIMTRRDACPKDGFDLRITITSDWLFWIETAMNGSIRYVDQVLGRYRRHGKNASDTADFYEKLLTLALVDYKYPELASFSRKYRSRHLYSTAVHAILKGESKKARILFLESAKTGCVSWKVFFWWGYSFFKNPLKINIAKRYMLPQPVLKK